MSLPITTVEQAIGRAQSAVRRGTHYQLGHGGFHPEDGAPTRDGWCDCSGFVAWCFGVSRHTDNPWYVSQNGGWFETTAILRDANTAGFGMFNHVLFGDARPGDVLVYGDHEASGHPIQGHIGLVAGREDDGRLIVIHCSRGNDLLGDAIQESGPELWRMRGGIAARWAPFS